MTKIAYKQFEHVQETPLARTHHVVYRCDPPYSGHEYLLFTESRSKAVLESGVKVELDHGIEVFPCWSDGDGTPNSTLIFSGFKGVNKFLHNEGYQVDDSEVETRCPEEDCNCAKNHLLSFFKY